MCNSARPRDGTGRNEVHSGHWGVTMRRFCPVSGARAAWTGVPGHLVRGVPADCGRIGLVKRPVTQETVARSTSSTNRLPRVPVPRSPSACRRLSLEPPQWKRNRFPECHNLCSASSQPQQTTCPGRLRIRIGRFDPRCRLVWDSDGGSGKIAIYLRARDMRLRSELSLW